MLIQKITDPGSKSGRFSQRGEDVIVDWGRDMIGPGCLDRERDSGWPLGNFFGMSNEADCGRANCDDVEAKKPGLGHALEMPCRTR
jgi:hypothetical protein